MSKHRSHTQRTSAINGIPPGQRKAYLDRKKEEEAARPHLRKRRIKRWETGQRKQKSVKTRSGTQGKAVKEGRLKGERNLRITTINRKPIGKARFSDRYLAYLQSPEWRAIRQRVLDRDDHKCRTCGSTKILQVHHLTYKRLFHERLSDLVTLCKQCHMALHKRKRNRP